MCCLPTYASTPPRPRLRRSPVAPFDLLVSGQVFQLEARWKTRRELEEFSGNLQDATRLPLPGRRTVGAENLIHVTRPSDIR
jgi:hypothetical protein